MRNSMGKLAASVGEPFAQRLRGRATRWSIVGILAGNEWGNHVMKILNKQIEGRKEGNREHHRPMRIHECLPECRHMRRAPCMHASMRARLEACSYTRKQRLKHGATAGQRFAGYHLQTPALSQPSCFAAQPEPSAKLRTTSNRLVRCNTPTQAQPANPNFTADLTYQAPK